MQIFHNGNLKNMLQMKAKIKKLQFMVYLFFKARSGSIQIYKIANLKMLFLVLYSSSIENKKLQVVYSHFKALCLV